MGITLSGGASANLVQNSMKRQYADITTSIQKITSGTRVFRAEEDPAAIVSGIGMKTELAALNKAKLNASTGISMLQVADSALGNMADIASRMQTLASQASSGQNSDADRILMNLEFQELKNELTRISEDTEFNGVKLLKGRASYLANDAASPAADGISNVLFERNTIGDDPAIRYTYDSATEILTATRIDAASSSTESIDITQLLNAVAGNSNNIGSGQTLDITFNTIGVRLTLDSSFVRSTDILPTLTDSSGADITITTATAPFVPATTDMTTDAITALKALANPPYNPTTGALTLTLNTDGTTVELDGITGLQYSVDGAASTGDGSDSDDLVSVGAVYADISVTTGAGAVNLGRINFDALATAGATNGSIVINIGQGIMQGTYQDDSAQKELTYVIGNGINNAEDQLKITIDSATIAGFNLTTTALITEGGSGAALQDMKAVVTQISQMRATVGSQQSRLEFAARNIYSTIENTQSAVSELLDMDVAEEITTLTTSQAMYEASLAMMARVNEQPQQLLQLLRNG